MALADLVVVMNQGRIEQAAHRARGLQQAGLGLRGALHRRPQRAAGRRRRGRKGEGSFVAIRADRITVQPGNAPVDATSLAGVARSVEYLGSTVQVGVDVIGPGDLVGRGAGGALRRQSGARPASRWFCRGRPRTCMSSDALRVPTVMRRRNVRWLARSRTVSDAASVLKGAAGVAGAALGSGAITGFPTIWAQNNKNITLRQFGTGVSAINEIAEKCKADLGITLQMTALDSDAVVQRVVTQPNSFDIADIEYWMLQEGLPGRRRCSRWTSRRSSTSTRSCRSSPPAS